MANDAAKAKRILHIKIRTPSADATTLLTTMMKNALPMYQAFSDTQVRLLSGGNLQRLILAREIDSKPKLMVAVQPTRGLDVGAIETVHAYLREAAAAGVAILLISEDLDEVLALADPVGVLHDGRLAGVLPREQCDVEELGLLMGGAAP